MGAPHCRRRPLERLFALFGRRCRLTVPCEWLDEPPAEPDMGVREPRRPRPDGGSATGLAD